MKYLLSILILFSGLSFSKSYLICDKPYTLYPEVKERQFLALDTDKGSVEMTYLLFDEITLRQTLHDDLLLSDMSYRWANFKYYLDRRTGILNSEFECQKATKEQYLKAEKKLKEINNKALQDRKI